MLAIGSVEHGVFKPKIFDDIKCSCDKTDMHAKPPICLDDTGGKITSVEGDNFSSLVNVGCMIGALLGGYLADKIGRKGAILSSTIFFIPGWIGVATLQSATLLYVFRILTGIGVGIASVSVPTYIAETAPAHLRGTLGACNQLCIVGGILIIDVLGFVLPHHPAHLVGKGGCDPGSVITEGAYKMLGWIGMALSVALAVLMTLFPETPSFLASSGKIEQAENVLKRLRGVQDVESVQEEMDELLEKSEKDPDEESAGLSDLLDPDLRMPMIIACSLMIFQQFSGINAVIFFAAEILKDAGMANADLGALLIMLVQVFMTVVACYLVDRAGRKILLISAALGMCFFAGTIGLYFYLKEVHNHTLNWLSLVSLFGYVIFFSLGLGAVPWIIMSEVFPERVRGIASSVATVLNWICSFILTKFFAQMKEAITDYGTFWFFSVMCLGCAIFVQLVVPETKGRSLEEIEASFKRK
jgi:SP family facilitated glucose transporter-like MFS transporter 8